MIPIHGLAQTDAPNAIKTSGKCWTEACFTEVVKSKYVAELDLYGNFSNNSANSANILNHFTQFGIRAWLHHYVRPRVKISGGVGYWRSLRISDLDQTGANEFRLSLQALHILTKPGFSFIAWLRADARLMQREDHSYKFSPRLIVTPKLLIPLNSKIIRERVFYLIIYDEMILNLDESGFLNQNTARLGLGYQFTKYLIVEMGLNNQQHFNLSDPVYITNALNLSIQVNNLSEIFGK